MVQKIIDDARKFVGDWRFTEIERVTIVPGVSCPSGTISKDLKGFPSGAGLWTQTGENTAEIKLSFTTPPGHLAHEIFHSVLHRSPLQEKAEVWCEGFCEAFAYLYVGGFEIPRRWELHPEVNTEYQLKYQLTAERILETAHWDLVQFRLLFEHLNEFIRKPVVSKGWLNRWAGFDPERGFLD